MTDDDNDVDAEEEEEEDAGDVNEIVVEDTYSVAKEEAFITVDDDL